MTQSWTQDLWTSAAGTYQAIFDHPFVTGLTKGDLDEASFAYYVAQDAHYLRDYARALAIVGAKAPTHADTGLFARHAAETVAVELALHETLLAELGLDPAVVAVRRCRRPRRPTPATCSRRPTVPASPRGSRPCCRATGSTPG